MFSHLDFHHSGAYAHRYYLVYWNIGEQGRHIKTHHHFVRSQAYTVNYLHEMC